MPNDNYSRWVQRKAASCTAADMRAHVPRCRPIVEYKKGVTVRVNDRMNNKYSYTLAAAPGQHRIPGVFEPKHTPQQMLERGIFGGKYLNDCMDEYPREWFEAALAKKKLSPSGRDFRLNAYGEKSGQPLNTWRHKRWLYGDDERGWFQWYCRYYLGRRNPEVDAIQMRRWRQFKRHLGQVRKHGGQRPRQRQALLQWAHDDTVSRPSKAPARQRGG